MEVWPDNYSPSYIETDKAYEPGSYSKIWDRRNSNGDILAFDDVTVVIKYRALEPNTIALKPEDFSVTDVSAERLVISQQYNEVCLIKYTLNSAMDNVDITIKDPNGSYFRTISCCPNQSGLCEVIWDARDDNGNLATLHGDYIFTISADKQTGGITTTVERKANVVLRGDFRVDVNGNRLETSLSSHELYTGDGITLIGASSSEQ